MSTSTHLNVSLNPSSVSTSTPSSALPLYQLLSTLSPNITRNDLYFLFHKIIVQGHLYHSQWQNLPLQSQIFDLLIQLIQKYEANGLQLTGYGVMILERLLVEGNCTFTMSSKYSLDTILEVLLRILLEHPIYLLGIQILWNEIKKDSQVYSHLCHVLIRIADELPHPLLVQNFVALTNFLFEYLSKNWDSHLAHVTFHALMAVAPIVESTNVRYDFHKNKIWKICHRFYDEIDQMKDCNPLLKPPLVTLFTFFKEFCPLHPSWRISLVSEGFVQHAIDLLLSTLAPGTGSHPAHDQQLLTALFQFLTSVCWLDDALLMIMQQISRLTLQEILNYCWFDNSMQAPRRRSFDHECPVLQIRENISSISSFVDFCSATYGNHFVPVSPNDQLISLIETYFLYSIETLKLHSLLESDTLQWTDNVVSILTGLKHFGRGRLYHLIHRPPSSSNLQEYKYQVINLVKYYLPSLDSSVSDLQPLDILAVDVYSLLNSYLDECWKTIRTTDEELQTLLNTIHLTQEREIKHSSSLLSVIVLNNVSSPSLEEDLKTDQPKPASTVVQRSSPSFSEDISPLSDDVEKSKYPLLQFFLDEMNGISIGENVSEIVHHFLEVWECSSNLEVHHKILILVGILRSSTQVLPPMESSQLTQFAEVLLELLTDDRHGIQDHLGMQEKCIQLLIDICNLDKSCLSLASQAIDLIFEILSSISLTINPFLIYTCLSYLFVVSELPACGKLIIQNISKLENIIRRCGSLTLLIAVMNLYHRINHLFSKFSTDDEKIVVRWIVFCVTSKLEILRCYGCQYICSLSQQNRQFIFRGLSRSEIEIPLINEVNHSKDVYSVLLSLKTLSILALNFNETPTWYLDFWLLPWHYNRKEYRKFISLSTLQQFFLILKRFSPPENQLILGYLLLIFTSNVEIQLRLGNEEYGLKFFSLYLSELSYLLGMITSQYRYVSIYDAHAMTRESRIGGILRNGTAKMVITDEMRVQLMNEIAEARGLYEPLLNTALLPINPAYEFLSSCTVQTISTLISFDFLTNPYSHHLSTSTTGSLKSSTSNSALFLFYQYEILFHDTPLGEAIIYLMLQYPHHSLIQLKGITLIQHFLANILFIPLINVCYMKLLCQIMENYSDDTSIHSSFCRILISLVQYNATNIDEIINSPLLKWIVVILKYYSSENGTLTCQLLTLLARDEAICDRFASLNVCNWILQLVEKYSSVLHVQIEGIRALCSLGMKSMKCLRQIKQSSGDKLINKSRQYLLEIVAVYDEGITDQIDHSNYDREDLVEVINLSNPKRFLGHCIIA